MLDDMVKPGQLWSHVASQCKGSCHIVMALQRLEHGWDCYVVYSELGLIGCESGRLCLEHLDDGGWELWLDVD